MRAAHFLVVLSATTASLTLVACGSSSSGSTEPTPSGAGAAGGSSGAGGSATGGTGAGGSAAGASGTGGAATGGSNAGGAATGGAGAGGAATGGAATGGSATGGSATGGSATGGSATGGSATGGSATGGTATGGAAGATHDFANPSQACVDVATVTCTLLDQCRADNATDTYGSQAACIARQAGSCALSELAPNTAQNDTSREACAMAQMGESCGDYVTRLLTPAAACLIPAGTLAMGSPCGYSAQCASAFCNVSASTLCGVCSAPPSVGTDCSQDKSCGQTGLRCVTDAVTMAETCQMPLADAAPCLESSQCGEQSFCFGAAPKKGTMGTCKPFIETMGTACDVTMGLDCDVQFAGLTCDTTMKTCQPIVRAAAGEACGTDMKTKMYTGCATGSTCDSNVCVAIAADGAACDSTVGPTCLPPAVCVVTQTGAGGAAGAAGSAGAAGASTAGVCTLRDATMCK